MKVGFEELKEGGLGEESNVREGGVVDGGSLKKKVQVGGRGSTHYIHSAIVLVLCATNTTVEVRTNHNTRPTSWNVRM